MPPKCVAKRPVIKSEGRFAALLQWSPFHVNPYAKLGDGTGIPRQRFFAQCKDCCQKQAEVLRHGKRVPFVLHDIINPPGYAPGIITCLINIHCMPARAALPPIQLLEEQDDVLPGKDIFEASVGLPGHCNDRFAGGGSSSSSSKQVAAGVCGCGCGGGITCDDKGRLYSKPWDSLSYPFTQYSQSEKPEPELCPRLTHMYAANYGWAVLTNMTST
jgi:hypothetical protein